MKHRIGWNCCCAVMVVLCILALSPLVLAPGQPNPMLWGLPRTLWLGLLIYGLMVLVTFIATRVYPQDPDHDGDLS
jgi:hypothetical protein